jgi:pimeloyl-ACP methyl ester carboxylesterase
MQEQEVSFLSAGLRLAGTLALPSSDGRFPGVLLIGGSGRIDRNQNHETISSNIFLDIANHLAGQGFASLRYDKRGIGLSQGSFLETGFFDNVADAFAALDYLRACEETLSERVFILGASEGAVISTRMAGQGADVAGAILVAGSMRKGEDALKWQAQQVVEGVEESRRWELLQTQLSASMSARWLSEFLDYDPSDDFARIGVPVLAITGSKDIQANPRDLQRMSEIARTDFECHELPDVTHVLRTDEGEPSLSTYLTQLQQPVDSGVLDCISEWLRKHTRAHGDR